ncbi:MAG: exodeoxyribonuclease VII small subunit [Actinomycetota bacterium]|nr:exodeoxyribonuclease VII small subunit [Actinomycetota bacterium]
MSGPAGGSSTPTFEDLMAALEETTARLAAGDLGIEAAAELYERAEQLHAQATERLQQVRARVEGLTRPAPVDDVDSF